MPGMVQGTGGHGCAEWHYTHVTRRRWRGSRPKSTCLMAEGWWVCSTCTGSTPDTSSSVSHGSLAIADQPDSGLFPAQLWWTDDLIHLEAKRRKLRRPQLFFNWYLLTGISILPKETHGLTLAGKWSNKTTLLGEFNITVFQVFLLAKKERIIWSTSRYLTKETAAVSYKRTACSKQLRSIFWQAGTELFLPPCPEEFQSPQEQRRGSDLCF